MKVTLDTPMSETEEPPLADIRSKVSAMRRSYGEVGLSEVKLDQNPISQFTKWLADAATNPFIVEANAMVLSTVFENQPTSRSVLLKDVTENGFTFLPIMNRQKRLILLLTPTFQFSSLGMPWSAKLLSWELL